MSNQPEPTSPYYIEEAFRGYMIVMTAVVIVVFTITVVLVLPSQAVGMAIIMDMILVVASAVFLFTDGIPPDDQDYDAEDTAPSAAQAQFV